jgi:PAS domain S-box-containing protein
LALLWVAYLLRVRQLHQRYETLRRNEALFRLTIDTIPAPVWSALPDGSMDFINQRLVEFCGFSPDQGLGWGWESAVYAGDRDRLLGAWRAAIASGKAMEVEARMRRADGQYRWLLIRNVPLHDEAGKIVKWYGASADIDDRKQAEQALRKSQAYLAESQRLSHTGSWAWDVARGKYIYSSEENSRIYGFDPQEGTASGEAVFQRIHPEDRKRWKENLEKSLREKVDTFDEYRIVLSDGTVKHIHTIRHPVLNDAGDVVELLGTSIDITERKLAEEALRRTAAYLAETQRLTHTGTFVSDNTTEPLYWSEELFRIYGFDPQQGLPTRDQPLLRIHPEDLDNFWQAWRKAIHDKVDTDVEFRIVLPDGTVKHAYGLGHPVLNAKGELVEIVGTTVDITERKRAEEALRQSEAYLAEAQRLSHTGSWALDVATDKYLYWSEEMFRINGFDPREPLPTRETVFRLILPQYLNGVEASFQKSLCEKVDTSDEYGIMLRDGTIKHIHIIRHPVLNDTGDVVQLVGTAIDITERKQAEEALREGETRFRTFVDHAGDALFVLDFEERTIVDVNRQACDSLGYTRQELIGKTPLAVHLDSERAEMESAAERAAAGETVFDRHWHRRKDGSTFPVEVHTSVFWHGGRRFLLKVARDISDRVRAQEQRERLHQLEADLAHMNRVSMMGELTASIAHEVNQPLSGVVSNASACLRWLAGDTPNMEEAREAARRIVRDGKRAAEVVVRVRALTKRTAASREKLDLNETIREVLAIVGDEAKKNSVVIRTGFSDDIFPVLGDRVQLQQVVLNLVMNGIEAMSSVSDQARELAIITRKVDSEQVQVTVQDAGKGLDPDTMPKIFDPFYTTKPHGMGMGLSISRSILQAHGGQLWAAANDGPGTSFHFTLPRYDEESHAAA